MSMPEQTAPSDIRSASSSNQNERGHHHAHHSSREKKTFISQVTIAVSAIATVLDAGTTSFPSLRLRFCFSPSLLSISSSEATPFGHECRTD